ncbi:MAG: MDR family MFS transporter [Myxococcaceae bacterium]
MTASSEGTAELRRQQKLFTLLGALLGLFLAAMDQTVVATAGPAIQHGLAMSPSLYPWITTAYLVASTVMVPVYGKLSDLYGRKPVLLAGIGIFLAGSLLCGLAQSTLGLIVFRAVQGLGAAALFTSAFAVVADLFPPSVRGRYTGLFGAVFGLSSVVGPLAGGFLTDHLSWHWVFFVNLPIGAVAVAFIVLKMPRLHRGGRRARVDVAGALALALFVVPLLLALSLGPGLGWGSWRLLFLCALAAAGVVAFIVVESRVSEPILDLRLFQNRTFAVGTLATFVLGAAFLASFVFLPLFMVNVVGLSATRTGLTTVPLTFGVVLGNIVAGQLVSRFGRYRPLMLSSLVVLMGAFIVMGFTLTPHSGMGEVTLKMVLVGVGMGPSLPLYTLAVQNALPARNAGVATATSTFFRQMGSTVGVALVGTVFATALAGELRTRVAPAAEGLPPRLAAGLLSGQLGAGGAHHLKFEPERLKEQVREHFAKERRSLEGDPAGLFALDEAEQRALGAVDRVGEATREAFTQAIQRIYRLAFLVAALGFLLTLFLPEVPLRTSNRAEPAAALD